MKYKKAPENFFCYFQAKRTQIFHRQLLVSPFYSIHQDLHILLVVKVLVMTGNGVQKHSWMNVCRKIHSAVTWPVFWWIL